MAPAVDADEPAELTGGGLLGWVRRRSLWVMVASTGCCRPVGTSLGAAPFEGAFRGGRVCTVPEQADVLLVMGPISLKVIPALRELRERMSSPSWVIAAGACACSGAGSDTYAVVPGLDRCLPVDLYVPGCPPAPEDLLGALEALRRTRRLQ